MARSKSYTRLTKADLTKFDDLAQRMILAAMEVGAVGRISARGHAILRSPSGCTSSVPAHMGDNQRTYQNTRAALRRCFPKADIQ